MTGLPKRELDAFLLTVKEAADLGSVGQVLGGYRPLLSGIAERVTPRHGGLLITRKAGMPERYRGRLRKSLM